MLVLLYGADELAMRRHIQGLKDVADGGSGMLATNLTELDGRDVRAAEIVAAASVMPFLGKRLVIVEHFFERFESRGGPGEATAGSRRLAAFEPLIAALQAGIPESTILVFTGISTDRAPFSKNPMLKALRALPGAEDRSFPRLQGEGILRYIRSEAASRGIKFKTGRIQPNDTRSDEDAPAEIDPAQLLANLLQSDTLSIANELDKLALYTGGGEVGIAEVNAICSGERETDNFRFVDAVQDGNLAVALERLAFLRRDGAEYQAILGMIISGYRRSATILELLEDNAPTSAIAAALGNAGQFSGLREAAVRRARRLANGGLRQAYAAIIESERAMKSGETREEVAFEIMLMRLTGLVGSAPHRPLASRF